jgi:hypothetical protein
MKEGRRRGRTEVAVRDGQEKTVSVTKGDDEERQKICSGICSVTGVAKAEPTAACSVNRTNSSLIRHLQGLVTAGCRDRPGRWW